MPKHRYSTKFALAECFICAEDLFRTDRKYCSTSCRVEHDYIKYIFDWKMGLREGFDFDRGAATKAIRRYLFEKYNNQCISCGWNEIHPITQKIPLHIDHIDGNAYNNKAENLRLLCPNCHSLTSNYGSLNRGKGTRKRRYCYT